MKQEITEQQKQTTNLKRLSDSTSDFHNLDFYRKMKMEQHSGKYDTISFDKIEEILLLLNQGYSLFEIAIYYQTTEEILKGSLYTLKINGIISPDTYKYIQEKDKKIKKDSWLDVFFRMELLEQEGYDFGRHFNTETYNNYSNYKMYRSIIWEFATNNKDVADLAKEYCYSIETIKKILENKEYLKLFPIERQEYISQTLLKRKAELLDRKKKEQKRIHDAIYGSRTTEINIKFCQLEKNKDYYFKLIVTFRLTMEDFSKIMGIDFLQKEWYYRLLKLMNSETKKRALQYVFECYAIYYPDTDERRLKEAKAFDKKLKLAQLMNDKTTAKELLDSLNDAKYHVVAEKRRSTKELTEEEWEEIFHYRFKYAIPYRRLNISHQTVAKHLPQKYKQENEILNHYLKEPEIYRLSYSKNLMRKRIVMHQ